MLAVILFLAGDFAIRLGLDTVLAFVVRSFAGFLVVLDLVVWDLLGVVDGMCDSFHI